MDVTRFETLLRSLAIAPSRRSMLRLLAGSALGGVLLPDATPSQAHTVRKKCKRKSGQQKKRCRKQAKKHNARHNRGCTLCSGKCVNFNIDPSNCGGCGRGCMVNEACVNGRCRCGSGSGCGDRGMCCPGGGCKCSTPTEFIDPATCQAVSTCPAGSTPCIGPSGGCGPGATTRNCCPSGTTCSADGTCLQ